MPKQVVVMMSDHYPFGQCEQNVSEDARILVRKIYEVGVQEINKLLQKANILRRLKSEQLIKLESVLQEDESVHFLFEYVPIRLETWISNINDQFIQNFRDQLVKFSHYLANNSIIIEFKLKNIGMDHDYGAKYFLDPGFMYDPSVNKQRLKSQYIRDIHNLFKPYIENDNREDEESKQSQATHVTAVTLQPKRQQAYVQKQRIPQKPVSKSPPTFNQMPQSRRKQPNMRGYPTDINVSVDEQVLTDILGVLDDDQEEQEYRPKSYTEIGQDNYFGGAKYEPPIQKFGLSNGMMKQSGGYDHVQSMANNAFGIADNKKVNVQNNINQVPKAKQNALAASQPSNNGRSSQMDSKLKQSQESEYQEQVIWRQGDDLQHRIRKAIENSRSIIRRFKSFKGTANL